MSTRRKTAQEEFAGVAAAWNELTSIILREWVESWAISILYRVEMFLRWAKSRRQR